MDISKVFSPDAQRALDIFARKIPFNQLMGFEFFHPQPDRTALKFDMRDELVGNFMRGNLHGGVISSALDVVGSMVAFVSVLSKQTDANEEVDVNAFAKLGTIDIRIDYLRPGFGKHFVATGYNLRTGSKVAVSRMELHNDESELIAVGTGAYIVG